MYYLFLNNICFLNVFIITFHFLHINIGWYINIHIHELEKTIHYFLLKNQQNSLMYCTSFPYSGNGMLLKRLGYPACMVFGNSKF